MVISKGNDANNNKENKMEDNKILEEFNINELEDRVEFGLCGGGGDNGGSGGGLDPSPCNNCEKAN